MTLDDDKNHLESDLVLASSMEVIRVLHVDDEEQQQMFLKIFVENDPSIKVTSTHCAQDVIDLVQTGAYDCIVSDYDMPDMDGITLSKKIRETSNIPIIIYTGRGSEEVAERAFAAGVDDYIRKEMAPAHYQVVSKRIRQAVERRRSNESYRNLFENASDAIFIRDLNGKILDANKAGCERLGYTREELLRENQYKDIAKNSINFKDNLEKIIRQGHAVFESVQVTCEGKDIPVEVSATVIRYMGVDAVLSFSRDISDRKRLEAQMKERLEALQSHALTLSQCEDVTAVTETTYQILHEIMGYGFFGLGVVEGDVLRFLPNGDIGDDWSLEYPLGGPGVCGRAVSTGSSIIVPDVRLDQDYIGPKSGLRYLSEIVVPVKIGGKVVAVINIEDEKLDKFTWNDAKLLEIFSEHVGSALNRLKMLESAKKYLSRLEQINRHAAYLLDLNSEKGVAEYTFEVFHELLGFSDGCIGIVVGDVIKFKYARNLTFKISDLPLNGKGITTRAVRTGKSQLVPDTRLDEDFVKDVEPVDFLSELDVPVKVAGRVIAVINLEDRRLGFFSEEDMEIVEILSKHVASAFSRIEHFKVIKASKRALTRSEERFRYMLDSAPEGVIVNVLGKAVYVNQHFADMMGYSVDELLVKGVLECTRDIYRELIEDFTRRRALGESVPNKYDVELIRKDGSFIPVEFSISRIVFNGENASLTFIRDISNEKKKQALQSRIASLHEHAHELNELRNMDDLANVTLDILQKLLSCKFLGIQLAKGENLHILATRGVEPIRASMPIGEKGVTAKVARERRTLLVKDTRLDPDFVKGKTDSLSEIATPILCGDELLGVLNAESLELNAFGEDEKTLMEALADEAGSAIKRIRSMELGETYKIKLEALSSHTSKLAKCLDLEEVAKITLETIQQVLGAEYGSFGLVEGDRLSFVSKTGSYKSWRKELPLSGPGVTVRAFRTGEAQLVPDTRLEKDYIGSFDPGTVFLSELVVPVVIGEQVKAVINLESVKADAFTGEDKRLVVLFADHVASAITRIKQIEANRENEETYRTLLDSSRELVALISGTTITYVNKGAAEKLGYESPSDLIGVDISKVLSKETLEEVKERALSRQRGEPQPTRYELLILAKNGRIVPIDASFNLIIRQGKPSILIIGRDVSEMKRQGRQVAALHRHAERLAEASTRDEIIRATLDAVESVVGFHYLSFLEPRDGALVITSSRGNFSPTIRLPLDGRGLTVRASKEKRSILTTDTGVEPSYVRGAVGSRSELDVPVIVYGETVAVINLESEELHAFDEVDRELMETLALHVASAFQKLGVDKPLMRDS
ncbi:MAG: GAF domain-containing protein [Candidatus Bathyarchaeia archaeon]|jgi:PAS domain S-box-containing protein